MDKNFVLEVTLAFLLALATVGLFIGWFWLHIRRARTLLNRWAAESHFEILSCQTPLYDFDPAC